MGWKNLVSTVQDKVTGNLSVPCHFKPDGVNVAFNGVFSNNFMIYDKEIGKKLITQAPNIFLKLETLPTTPVRDDKINVDGVTYYVKEYHPDGMGGAVLELYE